jgi:hypothetical protein
VALAGLLFGLAVITAVAFGTRLAWPWYTLVGSLSTFAFGLLASLMWPEAGSGNGPSSRPSRQTAGRA